MGKYKVSGDYDEVDVNVWLSNELAELVDAQKVTANNTNDMARQLKEANRLKRLELDLLISLHRDELKKSDELFHYREELEESKHEK